MSLLRRPIVGAHHAEAWSGLVLCREPGEGFAFRFGCSRRRGPNDGATGEGRTTASARGGEVPSDGEGPDFVRADGDDLYWLVREVGPHAPDGSYARMTFDPTLPPGRGEETPLPPLDEREDGLVLEWGRVGDAGVAGRVTTAFEGTLELVPYVPWDWTGRWTRRGDRLVGTSGGSAGTLGWLSPEPPAGGAGGEGPALSFPVSGTSTLRFAAAIDTQAETAASVAESLLDADAIDDRLERARGLREERRAAVRGPREGLVAAVTRPLQWMVLLQPESGRRYVPAGRRWIFPKCERPAGREDADREGAGAPSDASPEPSAGSAGPGPREDPDHWTVFGWDTFFNALELAVEDPARARETLEAGLATQYPNGNVPNWRGRFGGTPDRSQPPVGSWAVLKLYARTGDRSLLATAYPALQRWSAWWRAPKGGGARRDGNGDGLFEWGSDTDRVHPTPPRWERDAPGHQRAAWESGQDDLPNWDDAGWVEDAGTLDLGAVDLNSYLALDLECLARIAEILDEGEEAERHRAARRRLVDRMNERLWDEERGVYLDRRWSGELSPRIAASNFLPFLAGVPDEARACRTLETLTEPDHFWGPWLLPSVSRADPAYPDQQYWRGAVWPPMNYLVCQGLRRYGFYEEAGELARRSADLYLRSWRTFGACRENYDSRTGEGGGRRHQSWGPLLALLALEEYADATPWEGLRVGSLEPDAAGTLSGLRLGGRRLTVSQGPDGLSVEVDGKERIRTDGPAVLRDVELDRRRVSARVHTRRAAAFRIQLPGERFSLEVDGGRVELSEPRFRLEAGLHRLEVRSTEGAGDDTRPPDRRASSA